MRRIDSTSRLFVPYMSSVHELSYIYYDSVLQEYEILVTLHKSC